MKHRIKVKKAKQKLSVLREKDSSVFAIKKYLKEKDDLFNTIYKKSKKGEFVFSNSIPLDLYKVTMLALAVNGKILKRVCSPNGKPLTKDEVDYFLDKSNMSLQSYAKKVLNEDSSYHFNYELYYSNDKSKKKNIYVKRLYHQYGGSTLLQKEF